MSTETSSALVEASKEADAIIRVSPIVTKDETRTPINEACIIRPLLFVKDGRCSVAERPSQGNTVRDKVLKPSPRRPLSGTATGLFMQVGVTNLLNQSSVPRLASPTTLRVGSRLPSSVLDGRNKMIENYSPIPIKLVPIYVAEKPSTNRKESELKRLKTQNVLSPLVILTRLQPTDINTTVKKAAPKRYLRLEISRVDEKCNQPPLKRLAVRHAIREPPECLTSSDDETEKSSVGKTGCNRPSENVSSDENLPEMTNSSVPIAMETEMSTAPVKHSIACRSVRIGSYKSKNIAVHMTEECFSLEIPTLKDKVMVKINLAFKDMSQILVHFGDNLPLLAIKTTKSRSSTIRNQLQMSSIKGPCYNPDSSDELQHRIILIPHKLPEEAQVSIKKWFKEREVSHHNISHPIFEEITYLEANHILLKSVPPEIRDQVFSLIKSRRVSVETEVSSLSHPLTTKEIKSEASSKM